MTVLDTLTLALGIDSKGIDTGLAEAQRKIDQGARSLANSLMSPFKAALGSLIAGFSLAAMTRQYLQQADAIGKMADSIGADMEELQAWGEAAKQAGGSAEAFQGTVQSLTRNLQQATTNAKGPAAQALASLGVKAKDVTGQARDTFDVLRDLAGVMEGMDKQKAMALGQRIGIDRGTIMLLQSGRAAVDDLITEMKELGLYTKEDQEIAGKANREIAKLGVALKAASAVIMRVIVPAITWVTDKLIKLAKHFREHQSLYVSGLGIIATILSAKLIPQLIKVGALNAKIWAPYAVLAGVIAALSLIFEDLWVYMQGGNSALEEYWKELGSGPELLAKLNAAWEKVKTTSSNILAGFVKAVASAFQYLASKADFIVEIFGGLWDTFEGLFNFDFEKIGQGLAKSFTGAWHLIRSIFDDIFKGMGKMSVWDAVQNGAERAWNAVKKFATGFFNGLPPEAQAKLKEVWDAFLSFIHWDEIKAQFKWDDIKKAATTAWNSIKTLAKEVLEYLSGKLEYISGIVDGLWTAIGGLFNFDFKKIGEGFGQAFNSAYRLITSIFDDILGWFGDLASGSDNAWDTITTAAKRTWDKLTAFAKGFFSQLDPELQKAIQTVGVFAAAWSVEKTISGIVSIGKEVSGLKSLVSGLFNLIKLHPLGVLITVLGLIIVYWDDIKAAAQKFFDKLSGWTKEAGEWLSGVWDNFLTKTKEIWENIKNTVTTKMTALWESLKSIFKWETWETAFADIFKINFEELGQKIAKLFSWEEWKQAFSDIFKFVPDFTAIKNALTKVFEEAVKWLKEKFPWLAGAVEGVAETAKQAGNVVKQYASDDSDVDDEERGTDAANNFKWVLLTVHHPQIAYPLKQPLLRRMSQIHKT